MTTVTLSSVVAAAIIAAITIVVYYQKHLLRFIKRKGPSKIDAARGESAVVMGATPESETLSSATNDIIAPKCAACGKGGDDCLKTCNGCKKVKYCSVACQQAHRPKHKTKCQKWAAEILDKALFQQPPPSDDCPICFLRLPPRTRTTYQLCCGKVLCDGCVWAVAEGSDTCPFCRESSVCSDKKMIERCKKRMAAGDAEAFNMLACDYDDGSLGLPRDSKKAVELYIRAGELGCAMAYYNVACAYYEGQGVEHNEKKAIKYWQLAAMGGHEASRHNLGLLEYQACNFTQAMQHFLIAAASGNDESLGKVKAGYVSGHVCKSTHEKNLRAHKESQDEIKSDNRDKAIEARTREAIIASLLGRS